ncbi:helix-turn-helix domain-containing protein [Myroides odoratimimus]|uniref:helix-turn-helix domain-containing protein n=1 Tax=Myroides TaxID=76831 RepID=UPI002576BC94|nr:helix-turn-helix transcriptional regulator [Myroides odoratimimus]MDM1513733.1 helix-turn-helix transcriptional regulator [Myroides odoratimimus]
MQGIEDKIRNIRELKNLTQEYVAERLGMTQAGYSKIESGATKLSYNKIESISKVLEIEVEELLAFDSQKYFNSFNNVKGSNNGSVTIKVDNDIKKLYEEKIILLEKLLLIREEQLERYKTLYGEI